MSSRNGNLRWFWILSAGIVLMVSEGMPAEVQEARIEQQASKAKPAVPFTISVATTRITKPLKPDGTVDYAAALNARMSEGVTPENNAGVLLMQAIGAEAVSEAHREPFFKALGVPVPESGKGTLVSFDDYVEEHLKAKGNPDRREQDRERSEEQLSDASSRPWSKKDFPLIADWLNANTKSLDLTLQASEKTEFFIPLIVNNDGPLDLNYSAEIVLQTRDFARLLAARAMLALGEAKAEEAQKDLLACHHLASLLARKSTKMEALTAYAVDGLADEGDRALALSELITQQHLANYRQKLSELPVLPRMSETVDVAERFFTLDAINHLAMGRLADGELVVPNTEVWKESLILSVDWDRMLKRTNERYDRMVAILKLPSPPARQREIAKLEADLEKLRQNAEARRLGQMLFAGPDLRRPIISGQLENVLMAFLIPHISVLSEAEIRADTRRNLTIIALALAEYQREHGSYPASLSDLSPKYLKMVPLDRFTEKPLKYQRGDDGYLLYSVGINGKDDQGQDSVNHPKADDFSIRVPRGPQL